MTSSLPFSSPFLSFLQYDIVGHSGDGYDIELVRTDKVPKNNKQRLKVLKVRTQPHITLLNPTLPH